MFKKAIAKLTAIYIAILLCIIVIFSSVLYGITENNMDRKAFHIDKKPNYEMIKGDVEFQVKQRDKEIKQGIVTELVSIDIIVFVVGSFACYFLSKKTLQPIKEAYLMQERFVSDASHELRTPLTSMYMENEVILRDEKSTKNDFIELSKSNLEEIKKLQNLTNNLLNISKNEKIELIEVDIKDITDEVINRLNISARSKNITIENNVNSKTIMAEPSALGQIITILIDNSIKYSEENTKIQVENSEKTISVIDEGVGIAKDDLPHIFDRFYRADKSRNTEGFGLGLALAQKLAEKMNMKITAKNNEKVGSTFTIHFN